MIVDDRVLEKLDDLTTLVARIQGTQDAAKLVIETVSKALGDVMGVKIDAHTTKDRVEVIMRQLDLMAADHAREERDARWMGFLQHLATALATGGAAAGLVHYFH